MLFQPIKNNESVKTVVNIKYVVIIICRCSSVLVDRVPPISVSLTATIAQQHYHSSLEGFLKGKKNEPQTKPQQKNQESRIYNAYTCKSCNKQLPCKVLNKPILSYSQPNIPLVLIFINQSLKLNSQHQHKEHKLSFKRNDDSQTWFNKIQV